MAKPQGILGDGQLARMLADSAHTLGVPLLLYGKKDSPAGQVVADCIEPPAMTEFFKKVDGCIIESEFVNAADIAKAHGEALIKPNLTAIRQLQNKLNQKIILKMHNLPTSDFIEPMSNPDRMIANCLSTFEHDFVLKFATLGYDGKGVFVMQKDITTNDALNFISEAAARGIEVYAEKKINFTRELAMAATVSQKQEIAFYPLVVSEQRRGICDFVYGPATLFGATAAQELRAREILREIAKATGLIGTFAVEFFETSDQELLVNEIAPRVHNSAHYSMDGCKTSQFENHWRAILAKPLGSTETAPFFAMANLLGQTNRSMDQIKTDLNKPFHLHWYGKKDSRPGRKMGHINVWSNDPKESASLLKNLRKVRDQWQNDQL